MGRVVIVSKREGFRRCGVAHSAQPTEYAAGHWSAQQLAVLRREPMLIVVEQPDDGRPAAAVAQAGAVVSASALPTEKAPVAEPVASAAETAAPAAAEKPARGSKK